jgi:hypothetical protein
MFSEVTFANCRAKINIYIGKKVPILAALQHRRAHFSSTLRQKREIKRVYVNVYCTIPYAERSIQHC